MAKRKPPRRGTQEHLPGTEPERNERVYAAAKIYRDLMRKRVLATNKETDAHNDVLNIMHDEGLTAYNDGDINLILSTGKEKVKILEAATEKDDGEDDTEE